MLFRNDKKDDKEQGGGPVRVPLLPLRDIVVFLIWWCRYS